MWFSNNLVEPRESKISTELFNNWLFLAQYKFLHLNNTSFPGRVLLHKFWERIMFYSATVINQKHLKSIILMFQKEGFGLALKSHEPVSQLYNTQGFRMDRAHKRDLHF